MTEPRLYLERPFDFENETEVVAAKSKKGSFRVTTNCSLMEPENPEGGDAGEILGTNGVVRVERVTWDGNLRNQVHLGTLEGQLIPGDRVTVRVDRARRRRNGVYHTVSHLLTSVAREQWATDMIGKLQLSPEDGTLILLGQGDHLDHAAALEYAASQYLAADRPVSVTFLDADQAVARCGTFFQGVVPSSIRRWRVVELDGTPFPPIPCGGVHVDNLNKVTNLKITAIVRVGDDLNIGYTCQYADA